MFGDSDDERNSSALKARVSELEDENAMLRAMLAEATASIASLAKSNGVASAFVAVELVDEKGETFKVARPSSTNLASLKDLIKSMKQRQDAEPTLWLVTSGEIVVNKAATMAELAAQEGTDGTDVAIGFAFESAGRLPWTGEFDRVLRTQDDASPLLNTADVLQVIGQFCDTRTRLIFGSTCQLAFGTLLCESGEAPAVSNVDVPRFPPLSLRHRLRTERVEDWFLSLLQPFYLHKFLESRRRGVLALPEDCVAKSLKWDCLRAGDVVECLDTVRKWYDATVLEVDAKHKKLKIHYNCWGVKWDEFVSMDRVRLIGTELPSGMPRESNHYINATIRPFYSNVRLSTTADWMAVARRLFGAFFDFDSATVKDSQMQSLYGSHTAIGLLESRHIIPELVKKWCEGAHMTMWHFDARVGAMDVGSALLPADPSDTRPPLLPRTVAAAHAKPLGQLQLRALRIYGFYKLDGTGLMLARFGPNIVHYS